LQRPAFEKVKKLWESYYREKEDISIELLQEETPSEISNFRRIANDLTKFHRSAGKKIIAVGVLVISAAYLPFPGGCKTPKESVGRVFLLWQLIFYQSHHE
jgi:hypothetical protein